MPPGASRNGFDGSEVPNDAPQFWFMNQEQPSFFWRAASHQTITGVAALCRGFLLASTKPMSTVLIASYPSSNGGRIPNNERKACSQCPTTFPSSTILSSGVFYHFPSPPSASTAIIAGHLPVMTLHFRTCSLHISSRWAGHCQYIDLRIVSMEDHFKPPCWKA
jgi:hypothetical protein